MLHHVYLSFVLPFSFCHKRKFDTIFPDSSFWALTTVTPTRSSRIYYQEVAVRHQLTSISMTVFTDLPVEVVGEILKCLDSLETLDQSVLACRHVYSALKESHGVEESIMRNGIHPRCHLWDLISISYLMLNVISTVAVLVKSGVRASLDTLVVILKNTRTDIDLPLGWHQLMHILHLNLAPQIHDTIQRNFELHHLRVLRNLVI